MENDNNVRRNEYFSLQLITKVMLWISCCCCGGNCQRNAMLSKSCITTVDHSQTVSILPWQTGMTEIICLNVFIYTPKGFISQCEKCDQRLPADNNSSEFAWNWTCQHISPAPVLWKARRFHASLYMWSSYYTGYPDVPTRHRERKCNSHAVMMRKRAWVPRRSGVAAHILCNIL